MELKNKNDMAEQSVNSTSSLITHDEIIGHDYQGWPLYHLRVISFLRVDYQGWPLYHLRVISFLRVLGVSEDVIKQIPEDILKARVSTLDEDGMGYGVNETKCSNCSINPEKGVIYVWR